MRRNQEEAAGAAGPLPQRKQAAPLPLAERWPVAPPLKTCLLAC